MVWKGLMIACDVRWEANPGHLSFYMWHLSVKNTLYLVTPEFLWIGDGFAGCLPGIPRIPVFRAFRHEVIYPPE